MVRRKSRYAMLIVRTLDPIPLSGLSRFPAGDYRVGADLTDPDALLLSGSALEPEAVVASVKAVGCCSVGVSGLPLDDLALRGVPVFHAPGAGANAVKELVIAGLLLAARQLPEALREVAAASGGIDLHERVARFAEVHGGSELAGRTLGVIGLGAVGVQVANAGRALGMRVAGLDTDLRLDSAWKLSPEVVKAGSINEIYAGSDYLSLHVPHGRDTHHLFAADALARLRPGAVLLNFSHGDVVDPAVIRDGLASGRLGRYVTDFPVPALLGVEGVIALPRLGAATREAAEAAAIMVVDQVRGYLEQGNVLHAANFPSLQMPREGFARLCLVHRNRPNMIAQLSQALGASALNIARMQNAARGEVAYTLVDVDEAVPESVLRAIAGIDGMMQTRMI